jgi:hypothetical protein
MVAPTLPRKGGESVRRTQLMRLFLLLASIAAALLQADWIDPH